MCRCTIQGVPENARWRGEFRRQHHARHRGPLQLLLKRETNMKRINCMVLRFAFGLACTALLAGCGDSSPAAISRPSQDPSLRYIGPRGAVVVIDNHGRTKRLPPGTGVRAIRDTFPTPAGPMKIYVVTEGSLGGIFVPLSESDLARQ